MNPKILVLDIETSPSIVYTFGIRQQYININQIKNDWHLMSVAARWLGQKTVLYKDQSKVKNVEDDSKLSKWAWDLLDQADIVITKNGKMFDIPALNARFAVHKLHPPSPFRHYDVGIVAQKKFGFTSTKLEYLTKTLCPQFKKLSHEKFPGMTLWIECLRGNIKAWKEMKKYNCMDVIGTEAIYHHLSPYDPQINFAIYRKIDNTKCPKCESDKIRFKGYQYNNTSKCKRFFCEDCGTYWKDRKNLLSKEQKQSLKLPIK